MENKNYRLIKFDLQRAKKPSNPDGLEVVTKGGHDARIICTDKKGLPIVALINHDGSMEDCICYEEDGKSWGATEEFLCLKEPITQRRMTNQELSWWLREHPEEHRELSRGFNDGTVFTTFAYNDNQCDDEVPEDYRIRTHGGEWKEPLVEVEEDKLPFK